ncbi:hypothetical protein M5D96_013393 [Drosophila gunungcola]|uniref:Uncharacterized protein n=1 Tax=Drosophila gunungcola TaxID=103775 RepID=A0A9Q0BJE8_9MUSC|nr:hypothetical protein M5D96_013393 [Drosophila gunungcola]
MLILNFLWMYKRSVQSSGENHSCHRQLARKEPALTYQPVQK